MKNVILALVFISPPFLKSYMLRWFCRAKIGRHAYIGWFSSIMGRHIEMGDYAEVRSLTLIRCDGEVRIGAYSVISNFTLVYGAASFILGRHSYIGPQCMINADGEVQIGDISAVGPRSMIITHGSFLPYTEGYWVKLAGVKIGDRAWIAAGVFVHPGVVIGNDVFVNSRSVLSQEVPSGEIVEGFPAQRVAALQRARRKMTAQKVDAAVWDILKRFAEMTLRGKLGVKLNSDVINRLSFDYRGKTYLIIVVPSNGIEPRFTEEDFNKCCIFLVNRPYWTPPSTLKNPQVFDFVKRQSQVSKDRIHTELWRFLRMYFGLTFEFNNIVQTHP